MSPQLADIRFFGRKAKVSVVVIAMLAVLAGAGGATAIARWAKLKAEFLLKVVGLPHGALIGLGEVHVATQRWK